MISYAELQKILQYDVLFARPLRQDEKYVDFNKRSEKLFGYIFSELAVSGKHI